MKTHIDLFSGIGGFALAAHWSGFKTEAFCERDEFCQKVLSRHWPTVPIISDIRDFNGTQYAGADLLTGGFPCQPFSCVGKRQGNEDDRSLWPEMLRVISEARPTWIVGENVAGIINMALDGVLADLEGQGYATQAFVLPACAVNAPHKRDRVWIVANAQRSDGQSSESGRPGLWSAPIGEWTHLDAGGAGLKPQVMAYANRNKKLRKWSYKPGMGDMAHGLPARLAGHFDREPAIPRVATGIPQRVAKLKALGNSIVPQVAYEILRHIGDAP